MIEDFLLQIRLPSMDDCHDQYLTIGLPAGSSGDDDFTIGVPAGFSPAAGDHLISLGLPIGSFHDDDDFAIGVPATRPSPSIYDGELSLGWPIITSSAINGDFSSTVGSSARTRNHGAASSPVVVGELSSLGSSMNINGDITLGLPAAGTSMGAPASAAVYGNSAGEDYNSMMGRPSSFTVVLGMPIDSSETTSANASRWAEEGDTTVEGVPLMTLIPRDRDPSSIIGFPLTLLIISTDNNIFPNTTTTDQRTVIRGLVSSSSTSSSTIGWPATTATATATIGWPINGGHDSTINNPQIVTRAFFSTR